MYMNNLTPQASLIKAELQNIIEMKMNEMLFQN